MKPLLLGIVLLLNLQAIQADCMSSFMRYLPEDAHIPRNSYFIIEGYFEDQPTIRGFKERKVYLKAEDGTMVLLELVEINEGQMYLTQAIFKPTETLEPNTKYILWYDQQTAAEGSAMKRYNSKLSQYEPLYWKTTKALHAKTLAADLSISFKGPEVTYYGCGPAVHADFQVNNAGTAKLWYKTEVYEVETQTTHTYVINAYDGVISVGHGMCSGAFTYRRDRTYKVRFTAMNLDGVVLKTTDWIPMESPYKGS